MCPTSVRRQQGSSGVGLAAAGHTPCATGPPVLALPAGHAHPKVAAAVAQQLGTLNTNSRYLHEGLATYSEAIAGTMPDPLQASQPAPCSPASNGRPPTHPAASPPLPSPRPWPPPCLPQVVYMTVSGSEANDLAWRIACTAARRAPPAHGADPEPAESKRTAAAAALHVAVVDHAYHGHTSACIDLSPYKFKGPGGGGRPVHVHVLPCPDVYRG